MIILPLPSVEEVAKMTSPTMSLMPFQALQDIIQTTPFVFNDPSTYLASLTQPMMLSLIHILDIDYETYFSQDKDHIYITNEIELDELKNQLKGETYNLFKVRG